MHDSDTKGEVNETDLEAQRILAIAIALVNAKRPLPTSYFYENFYPGRDDEVRRKSFQRDRGRLARCGLVVERKLLPEGTAWSLDRASLAQPSALTPTEALTVDVALLPFASHPSFPYASDLRMALSKIDRSFSEVTAARTPRRPRRRSKKQGLVEQCLSARHALEIVYEKADGTKVERTVGIYGLFSLRDVPYMVAARLEDGQEPGPAHTYNIGRIAKAVELPRLSHRIPEDFEVRDYIKLPFQIGCESYRARFSVPRERLRELRSEAGGRGDFVEVPRTDAEGTPESSADNTDTCEARAQAVTTLACNTNAASAHSRVTSSVREDGYAENTDVIWSITVCDTSVAASWAVAEDIRPIEPAQLVREWRKALQDAAAAQESRPHTSPRSDSATAPTAGSSRVRNTERSSPGGSRGRRSGIEEARSLVALLGALSDEGDSISAEAISSRMGVHLDEAEKLLDLVSTAGGEDGNYLSVYADGDVPRLTLASFAGTTRGRPLRLTDDETVALHAAFDALGTKADDPLRLKVESSYASPTISPEEVRRSLSLAASDLDESIVSSCSRALAEGRRLTFLYRGTCDAQSRRRTVQPLDLRRAEGSWYLDATDLALLQGRTFRIDRMSDVTLVEGGSRLAEDDGKLAGKAVGRECGKVGGSVKPSQASPRHDAKEVTRSEGSSPGKVPSRREAPTRSEALPHGKAPSRNEAPSAPVTREVVLHFSDARYLALFSWPGLTPVDVGRQRAAYQGVSSDHNAAPGGSILDARIRYYGKGRPWLARHIAACRGTVSTDDPELSQEVREYISRLMLS